MQSIAPLTHDDFKNKAKTVVNKLEIFIDPDWIDVCNLNGKDYLVSFNYSSGRRKLTHEPIAATFSAVIDNTDGLFHPKNSESEYKDYFIVGRKIRFKTGFKKNGTPYLWQWVQGVITKMNPDNAKRQVKIEGFDSTQYLIDVKLRSPDNYWGSSVTLTTEDGQPEYPLPDDCGGPYIAYFHGDPIYNEKHWVYDRDKNVFIFLPRYTPSEYKNVEEFIDSQNKQPGLRRNNQTQKLAMGFKLDDGYEIGRIYLKLGREGTIAAGKKIWLFIYNTAYGHPNDPISEKSNMIEANGISSAPSWYEFTFPSSLKLRANRQYWIVLEGDYAISDVNYVYWPGNQGNPYPKGTADRWNGSDWLGYEVKFDSFFQLHAKFAFEPDNLVIHYYTIQTPENVVADLLVYAGLYASQAEALAAMDYTPTGKTIKRVGFAAGSSCFDAVKKICENLDYRFFFNYANTPIFKPIAESAGWKNRLFTFTKNLIVKPNYFENDDEIRNHIVIEGEKYLPVDKLYKMLSGEDALDGSVNDRHIGDMVLEV